MDASKFSVLLVDDEIDVLEFLSYNLKKEGFKVSTATNGKEAITKAIAEVPHLIILDVMMPEMDGIATCEEIKQIPALKKSLIIFLTARGEDYSQIAGFDAGADDYVTKPIKPKLLISRVKALLRRYQDNKTNATPQQLEVKDFDRFGAFSCHQQRQGNHLTQKRV
jgi:two-component system alkaline phosphatase synthesis response regulator PhoP